MALKDTPEHIAVSACTVSVTAGSTVTVNDLFIVQLPVVPVTVYWVVTEGDNTGLAIDVLLTPVAGDQLYVDALLIVLALNDEPGQMVVSACAVMVNGVGPVMVTGYTVVQELASVMVAW